MSYEGKRIRLPHTLQISAGDHPDLRVRHVFGSSTDIGTNYVPVTDSKTWPTPTSATALELVSDSADDAAAGTGARVVEVRGVTAWDEPLHHEYVTMTGLTAAPLTASFLRVVRLRVIESGTYGIQTAASHDSTITLRGSGGGATWAEIQSSGGFGLGQTKIGCLSLLQGERGFMDHVRVSLEATKTADLILFVRPEPDTVVAPFSPMIAFGIVKLVQGEQMFQFDYPVDDFVGPCDIGIMARASSGTTSLSCSYGMVIKDPQLGPYT